MNPLARRLDAGWNIAGGVGLSQGYVGLMLDGFFTDFGITHNALVRDGATRGSQRFWAVTVDPIVHVNERGPADFYLTGGAGIYGQLTKLRAPAGAASQFDLTRTENLYRAGVNGGAGFAFNLNDTRLKLFLEARYHHIFTPGSGGSLIPITVGVRF